MNNEFQCEKKGTENKVLAGKQFEIKNDLKQLRKMWTS